MEPGDPDLISSDISLILISSIQLPPGAPDLSLFGIPVLAGRLVFAVSWQPPARSESTPGGNTSRVAEQAAFGGAGEETSPGGFLQPSAHSQRPGWETSPSSDTGRDSGSLGMAGDGGHPHPLKEAPWHGGGLDVASLQMAFWAAEEGFLFFSFFFFRRGNRLLLCTISSQNNMFWQPLFGN